jgi:hypothetical protein
MSFLFSSVLGPVESARKNDGNLEKEENMESYSKRRYAVTEGTINRVSQRRDRGRSDWRRR